MTHRDTAPADIVSDTVIEYLAQAESTLLGYQRAELISDEAYLLRGCLAGLVAIGRLLIDTTPDTTSAPEAPAPDFRPCPACHAPSSNEAHRKQCRGAVTVPA